MSISVTEQYRLINNNINYIRYLDKKSLFCLTGLKKGFHVEICLNLQNPLNCLWYKKELSLILILYSLGSQYFRKESNHTMYKGSETVFTSYRFLAFREYKFHNVLQRCKETFWHYKEGGNIDVENRFQVK